MSSCKFYHDCILAPKKCEKKQNKTKKTGWTLINIQGEVRSGHESHNENHISQANYC